MKLKNYKKNIKLKRIIKNFLALFIMLVIISNPFYLIAKADTTDNSSIDTTSNEIIDYSKIVKISGDEQNGYYYEYPEDFQQKLQDMYNENYDLYKSLGVDSTDIFKKMIQAELSTALPNLGGVIDNQSTVSANSNVSISENKTTQDVLKNNNKFQGTINLRRLTPQKEIGEFMDSSENVDADETSGIRAEGLGKKESIPASIQQKMKNASMPNNATIKFSDLSYLTIPYIGYDESIKNGHMIVKNEMADEILAIFQELYSIKYPIYNIEIVDNYKKGSNNESTNDNISKNAANANDTYSFYYDTSDLNAHSTGNAIDLNPMINPKVTNGTTEQSNASDYIDRSKKDNWNEDAKASFIGTDTEVYKIFQKYGWIWGGSNATNPNYGHFEKRSTTAGSTVTSTSIKSRLYTLSYVPKATFDSYVSNNDKRALYAFTLDDNMNVITAVWSYQGGSGNNNQGIKIQKGKTISCSNALSKYAMPYQYLCIMLVHSKDAAFVKGLADLAIKSKYIITLEDEVTTTKVVTTKRTTTTTTSQNGTSSSSTSSSEETKITEKISQKAEATYVDSWFIKYWLTGNSSSYNLDSNSDFVDEEKNVKGTIKVTGPSTSSSSSNGQTTSDGNGNSTSSVTTTIITTTVNEYKYEDGIKHVTGNSSKFVSLYNKCGVAKNNVYIPWISETLASYERTANMIDITKYLFYQASNQNYGSTTLKFSDYEPGDFSQATGGTSSTGNVSISGNSFEEKVWNAMIAAGYSPVSTAGAMGNFQSESGIQVDRVQDDNMSPEEATSVESKGIGLAQWTSGRHTQVVQYTESKGKKWYESEELQIEFLLTELNDGNGPAQGYANGQLLPNNGYTKDDWKNAQDVETATKAFECCFERPASIRDASKRVNNAQNIYNTYQK